MKTIYYSLLAIALVASAVSCSEVSFKKTKSGLLYKIISAGAKDSVKEGEWLKFNYTQKVNDSVLQTTYGKMPVYQKITPDQGLNYNPAEIFPLLRKGDSAITVMLIDSIIKKGLASEKELPPFMKKGDKITVVFKVMEVFHNDSAYQVDAKAEYDKDRPRQEAEQKEQMAKMQKEMEEQRMKEETELTKSGEISKEFSEIEAYLTKRNIKATKIDKGIYIYVKENGTGPKADSGKYCTVKYEGKSIATDSTFQTSSFTRQLGVGQLIYGMDKGLQSFKKGDKGTIFIPGFLAYGKNPPQGLPFKPYESLKFDVEITDVTDTAPPEAQGGPGQR